MTTRSSVLARVEGAEAGLAALQPLTGPATSFQPYWAARAQLLVQAGHIADAVTAHHAALALMFTECRNRSRNLAAAPPPARLARPPRRGPTSRWTVTDAQAAVAGPYRSEMPFGRVPAPLPISGIARRRACQCQPVRG